MKESVSSECASRDFPRTLCKTLGKSDFILVPLPAANTTTDMLIYKKLAGGEGLEPSTLGPKPNVLPITPSPICYKLILINILIQTTINFFTILHKTKTLRFSFYFLS